MSRRTHAAVRVEPGLAWASFADNHGRRYYTDEFNHRVVVEDISGRSWSFGQFGFGAGELQYPRGLAVESHASLERTRVYVADTRNHRIQGFDGHGRPVFAFGGYGTGDGQFRAPAGVAIAAPCLPFEGERGRREPADVLVVADQWNGRLQVFTLDGVWLATIAGRQGAAHSPTLTSPFFRVGAVSVPRDPVRLAWQAPLLTVTGGNGRACTIDLASALLPVFEQWLLLAADAERVHARRYFSLLRHGQPAMPPAVLQGVLVDAHIA